MSTPKTADRKNAMISFDNQKKADGALLNCLKRTKPPTDNVTLTVTEFQDVLSVRARLPRRFTKHHITVNANGPLLPGETAVEQVIEQLKLTKGVPKTVRLTVKDKDGKTNYYPVGIAFMPKGTGGKMESKITRRDFSQGKAYLFGEDMYFTFSPKFDTTDLSKYAVIIQHPVNGQIGIIDPSIGNTCY